MHSRRLVCVLSALLGLTITAGCAGNRAYRLSKGVEKIDLRPLGDLYLRAKTNPSSVKASDALPLVAGSQDVVSTLANDGTKMLDVLPDRQEIIAGLYPVKIDGEQAGPGNRDVKSTLTIGGQTISAPGRKVTLSDTEVVLEKQDGDPHTPNVNFDIGGGIGIMTNTSGGANNDVMGVFAAVRGYPFGGWYAATKVGTGDNASYEYLADPRGEWFNRFSINFGISNSLGSDDIQDPALFLGLGFDISPQFAIVAGASWFELEDSLAAGNNNISFFFGTSMSLRALADLLTLKTSGFTNEGAQ